MSRVNLLLLAVAVACALGVITAQHKSRKLFIDLEAGQAEAKRLESIRYLKEILGGEDAPQGETRAEMLLRLADLYFQQGRYLYLGEMAAYDKKYDACFNDEACVSCS